MSNSKISALTSATTPLAGTEVLPIVQGGAPTKQVSVANLTAGRAVAATSLALNGATLTESLSVAGAIRSSGAITANAPGAVLAYQGSGSSYLGAWGATSGTYGTLSFYLATSNGAAGNVYATLSSTALTVNPNIVPQVAGQGINFTANTPAAGMTSQLLNWYEEGTWTPVLKGDGTAGTYQTVTAFGKYTRIGNQVTLAAGITLASSVTGGGTGNLIITGNPFTKAASTPSFAGSVVGAMAITVPMVVSFSTRGAASTIYVFNTLGNVIQVSEATANKYLDFTIIFQV